jgi:DNA-binding response OmpR family regulator
MEAKRILVADDDRGIQQMLRVCLEGAGYSVEQAIDGAQALESIHRMTPDVVLLDLAMPVLDGMTVLADLRSMLPESGMRVIVMTAHGSVRSAIQAVRLGAADFLEKPFKPEELRQSVGSVLSDPVAGDSATGYGAVLQSVRDALRRGKFIAAEAALMKAGTISDTDPCFMNLAGVLHEAHGRVASARNFYRKALVVDAGYEPAQQNLKRLDEFEQTGSTRTEVDLGDEPHSQADERQGSSPADRFARLLLSSPGPDSGRWESGK